MKVEFFASLALLFSAVAQAGPNVILFLDTNNAPQEIAAAQAGADARGIELVVVPDMPPEARLAIERLQSTRDDLKKEILALVSKKGLSDSQRSASISEKTSALNGIEEQLKLTQLSGDDYKKAVQATLKRIKNDGKSVADLVISGHGDGCWFSGDIGSINRVFLRDAMRDPKLNLSQALHGIYLWGCYGVTLKHGPDWKRDFPTANMIAGFDESGASSKQQTSLNYLQHFIEKEDQLTCEMDVKQVFKYMEEIKALPTLNAALYTNCVYVSQRWQLSTSDIPTLTCSDKVREHVESLLPDYLRYLRAQDPGFDQVPGDTQHSSLRELYTALRNTAHCDFAKNFPSPDQVLRLIFFQQVTSNFGKYYEGVLLMGMIEVAGETMNPSLVPDFKNQHFSRAEILKKSEAIDQILTPALKSRNPRRYQIIDNLSKALHHLTSLNCVPFNWVEPTSSGGGLTGVSPKCDDKDSYAEVCQ